VAYGCAANIDGGKPSIFVNKVEIAFPHCVALINHGRFIQHTPKSNNELSAFSKNARQKNAPPKAGHFIRLKN